MSFSEQPNEMLDMILNTPTIPLPQRMRLRAVSRRWLPVLEDGLARENTLVIRDENAHYLETQSKPDDLVVEEGILTEEFIRTLVRLFPTPTELILAFEEISKPSLSWSTVPTLLAQLGTNLTSVKLYGESEQAVALPLARALAALSNLTSLTLSGYQFNIRLVPHLGPVLARLEAFACPNPIGHVSASLIASSLSPRCTRLLLNQEVFDTFSAPLLAQLSASLTYLHLVACDSPKVTGFLPQMHRLTSLAIDFTYLEVNELNSSLFRHLVPFASLTELKLFTLYYRVPLALPLKTEKPLPTIQRLTLELYRAYDDDCSQIPIDYQAFFKSIGAWFPALTQLTLITDEDAFPDIPASLGEQSFSVKTVEGFHFNTWAPDW